MVGYRRDHASPPEHARDLQTLLDNWIVPYLGRKRLREGFVVNSVLGDANTSWRRFRTRSISNFRSAIAVASRASHSGRNFSVTFRFCASSRATQTAPDGSRPSARERTKVPKTCCPAASAGRVGSISCSPGIDSRSVRAPGARGKGMPPKITFESLATFFRRRLTARP